MNLQTGLLRLPIIVYTFFSGDSRYRVIILRKAKIQTGCGAQKLLALSVQVPVSAVVQTFVTRTTWVSIPCAEVSKRQLEPQKHSFLPTSLCGQRWP